MLEKHSMSWTLRITLVMVFLAIIAVWYYAPVIVAYGYPGGNPTLSEVILSVNTLLAALLFYGVMYALVNLSQQFQAQRKQLANFATVAEKQMELDRCSHLLAALPVLIEQEKGSLRSLDSHWFGEEATTSYHAQWLAEVLAMNRQKVDEARAKLESIDKNKQSQGQAGEPINFKNLLARDEQFHRGQLIKAQSIVGSLERLLCYLQQLEEIHQVLASKAGFNIPPKTTLVTKGEADEGPQQKRPEKKQPEAAAGSPAAPVISGPAITVSKPVETTSFSPTAPEVAQGGGDGSPPAAAPAPHETSRTGLVPLAPSAQ